jgi:hypothetical protein
MLLALLLLLGKPEWRDRAPLAGTYEIGICTQPCEWEETAKRTVSGTLVLFERDLTPAELDTPEGEYLLDESMFILGRQAPNACFVVTEPTEFDDSLAGLIPVGLTRWSLNVGIVSVVFYESPDASQRASGEMRGLKINAGKRQAKRLAAITTKYDEYLVGRRIGDASLDTCIQAARAELQTR